MSEPPSLVDRAIGALRELARYGTVGVVALVVDVGSFNILRSSEVLGHPILAKTASVFLATSVAFIGHRLWTFRHRRSSNIHREYVLFWIFSGVGLALALACLGFSHYLLGMTSAVADNVSANMIGLGLGTAFRYWTYKRFVFKGTGTPALETSRS